MARANLMQSERTHKMQDFLERTLGRNVRIEPIPGDASFRHYARVIKGDNHYIVMDAPPEKEPIKPFIQVARYLEAQALHAPKIMAEDYEQGFILLEDLGNESYSWHLKKLRGEAQKKEELRLYRAAVDVLVSLHQAPRLEKLPPYDHALLDREITLFFDWFAPLAQIAIESSAREEYFDIFHALYPETESLPRVVVLRDYHADNLMWLPTLPSPQNVGLLDFQDAVIGSPMYDLVSLLEDARRDLCTGVAEEMLAHYFARRPEVEPEDARRAYAILGAQRNIKIIGIFARLTLRDQKPRYLEYLPRVWKHLDHDLSHPTLAPLKDWFTRNIPKHAKTKVS